MKYIKDSNGFKKPVIAQFLSISYARHASCALSNAIA